MDREFGVSAGVKIPPVCTGGARAGASGAIGSARAGASGAIGGARASSARRANGEELPPGWHYDEDTGAIMRDVIHRMGRRCRKWDYHGRGTYLITMVLADRSKPILGRLTGASPDAAAIALSPLGLAIDAHLRRISEFTPEIEVLGVQVMPDHIHVVLRVNRRMAKPLGIALRGFKGGASKIFWGQSAVGTADAKRPLFAEGFVDNILGDGEAVANALRYLADNPRRLWEKRAHPELFRVLCDVEAAGGRFAAIGNRALLKAPQIYQVQVSRSFFAYRRDAKGAILKDGPPRIATGEFKEKLEGFLEAAAHGAVLLSPCISEGEREIARIAFEKGLKVITLANKGFSPLYKPGGRLFNATAAGNLLMLAPIAWPYQPGEKKMTRIDACILNRIAQWLSGDGAVEIKYRGVEPSEIDRLAAEAIERG